jgi:hypothetical protein
LRSGGAGAVGRPLAVVEEWVRMLVTNHVLSGAAIGAAVGAPVPAFALGVVSHFAVDAVPHWGNWGDRRVFLRIAVADGLVGLATIGAVAAATERSRRVAVLAGVFGAALPDMNKPGLVFFGRSPFPAWVDRFHGGIQHEAPGRFVSHELRSAAAFAGAFVAATLLRSRSAGPRASRSGQLHPLGRSVLPHVAAAGRVRALVAARPRLSR